MNIRNLLLLFLLPIAARAQLSDTLSEQIISGKRILKPLSPGISGMKTLTLDSNQLLRPAFTDLSRILTENLPVFIRTTGVNGPATLSIRGASAAQSVVLWEGVPIQNPAMGLTDISLLQSGLFQNITLVPGGAPALWGSGNVGGLLQLQNEPPRFPENRGWNGFAGLGSGSFNLFNGAIGLKHNGPKAFWSVRAFGSRADYAFDYRDEKGASKRIDNAQTAQYGMLVQGGQKAGRGWLLRQDMWLQRAARDLPPALFETQSRKHQEDEALRIRVSAEKAGLRHNYSFIAAALHEGLRYVDPDAALKSSLKTTTFFGKAAYQYRFGRGKVFADLPVQFSAAETGGNQYNQPRIGLGIGAENLFWNEKITASVVLRTEHINDQTVLLPGINGLFRVLPKTVLRASVQRSYRAPTLTELYYFPGGNAALKPEIGWGGELGARQELRKAHWQGYVDATAFHRNIQDWIIWYGGAIWTPHNIARVQTQGVELEGEFGAQFSGISFGLRPGFTYTRARTMESAAHNDGSVGCQIPHTPLTTARVSAWLSWKKIRVNAGSVYTGYRFITSDESAWIPEYWLHSASASYAVPLKKQTLHFEVRCNNLANTSYLSVAGRPGLPRHFTFGVLGRF